MKKSATEQALQDIEAAHAKMREAIQEMRRALAALAEAKPERPGESSRKKPRDTDDLAMPRPTINQLKASMPRRKSRI